MGTRIIYRIDSPKGKGPWRRLHKWGKGFAGDKKWHFCSGSPRAIKSWITTFKNEEYNRYRSGRYQISIYRIQKRFVNRRMNHESDEWGFLPAKAVRVGRMPIRKFLKKVRSKT